MAKFKDMTGEQFGRWSVLKEDGRNSSGSVYWAVKCECGNSGRVLGFALRNGSSKSCGCLNLELLKSRTKETMPSLGDNFYKHGESTTHFYIKWDSMRKRCLYNPQYRGRVTFCERWESYENFKDDMYESYLEHVSKHGEKDTTLDRIKNDDNYTKETCQWLTLSENCSKNERPNKRGV